MPETTPTTVLLVRHGETAWNCNDRMQGWAPTGLNDRGRRQASKMGLLLRDRYEVDRIVASDLRRTRETAALISEAGVGGEPTFDRGWRERDMGVYQGLTREDIDERFPAFTFESGVMAIEEQPEGGERLRDAYERVITNWEQLCADAAGETVLVVTHGGPITVLLGHLKGQDVLTAIAEHAVTNCALTEIRVADEVTVHCEAEKLSEPAVEE